MFTCIACTRKLGKGDRGREEEEMVRSSSTPSTKESVKGLTAQIKEIALKFSGVNRRREGTYEKNHRPHSDVAMPDSNGTPYPFNGGGSSTRSCNLVVDDENEPKEWTAQVEPGVLITFMSLPNGGNDLKRIRLCREMFNNCQAQQWWAENHDLIMELYDVQRFNRQVLPTPARSEEVREQPSVCGSRRTSSSRDEGSVSRCNAIDVESEWVEEDEAGVYITIRQLLDGTRELRRVRFSRDKFGEVRAKQWWEENRERVEVKYLSSKAQLR